MRFAAFLGSALLGLSMTTGATAADRSSVSLQVRSSFHGYRAEDVREFLSDPGYLGSIHSSLAPSSGMADAPPAGMVHVSARTPAAEVVTLQMIGGEGADVERAMSAVLEHLLAITPSPYEEAQVSLQYASSQMQRAEADFEGARERRLDYVDRHGASDPSEGLERVVHAMTMARGNLDHSKTERSAEEALREYLIRMIASSGMTGQEREALENDLRGVQAEYQQMQVTLGAKHPKLQGLAVQIDRINTALKGAVISDTAKDQRQMMEVELFSVERKLAIVHSRISQSESQLAELEARAKELSRVENSWKDIERDYYDAETGRRNAREQLHIAERQLGPLASTPWLRVLAGPTHSNG